MKIITNQNEILGPWMCQIQKATWEGSGQCIGLATDSGELVAVVCFDQYNKANVNMHVASVPGKHWMTKEYLWYCFHYPFIELKVKRITGLVASNNMVARKFDEHLGFTLEATLKDAHPDGDLLVYCMTRAQCRWLTLKDSGNGKAKRTSST